MHYAAIGARFLLGLIYVVFGLNFFLGFLPMPPMPDAGMKFMDVFVSGRFMHLVKIVEISGGVLLLSGRFVPLALTLLAPITVGILMFSLFVVPNPVMPIAMLVMQALIAHQYRDMFLPMLRMKSPGGLSPASRTGG